MLDVPAAVQLNYFWVAPNEQAFSQLHDAWQMDFDAMGYPTQSRNIAISNGNECATDFGYLPGDNLVLIDEEDDPAALLGFVQGAVTGAIGVLTIDPILVVLGLIPGDSEWTFDFEINSNPDRFDTDREVYFGKIRYKKKLLWLFNTSYTLTERNIDASNEVLEYETFTGGANDIKDRIPDVIGDRIAINFNNPMFGFIPVVSALDVRRSNDDLPIVQDFKRSYAGGDVDFPNLTSEFDNFIVDYIEGGAQINNEHISFQTRNGDFLAEELNRLDTDPEPDFDCRIFCDGDETIQGAEALCSSGLYFIDISPIGVTTNWSLSNTSVATITSSTNTDVTIQAVPNQLATVTLTAVTNIPDCGGFTTLTKEIRIGGPETPASLDGPEIVEKGATTSYDAGPSEGSSAYEWDLPGFHQNVTTFDQNSNNWQLRSPWNIDIALVFTGQGEIEGDVRVRGINYCGTSPYRSISVTVERGGDGGIERSNQSLRVLAYPNPASSMVHIVLDDTYGTDKATRIERITIYDNTMLPQRVSDFGDGESYGELDVSVLRTGIYFIEVITDRGTEIKKLLID